MGKVTEAIADKAREKEGPEGVLLHVAGYVLARLRRLFACLLGQSLSPALPPDCLSALKLCSFRRGHGPCRFPRLFLEVAGLDKAVLRIVVLARRGFVAFSLIGLIAGELCLFQWE